MAEKLIKSKERVQKFAEVYTPANIVKDMCDLIPETLWDNIERRFLEPACGSGNFLAEIFERKLTRCKCEPEGLVALSSIYGIDILPDNVEESRQRLFDMFIKAFPQATVGYLILAELIIERNIICGDSLEIMKKKETERRRDHE
jgi:type I restriction-modification system DNA methylase subunit